MLVESNALANHPLGQHSWTSFDDGAGAFPARRERVVELYVVLAAHEKDVTRVDDRGVDLDLELVWAWLLNGHLAEAIDAVRLDLH